jgi:hypothetical protein
MERGSVGAAIGAPTLVESERDDGGGGGGQTAVGERVSERASRSDMFVARFTPTFQKLE